MGLLEQQLYPGELARMINQHSESVRYWTKGRSSASRRTAERLERVIGLTPGRLVQFAGRSEDQAKKRMKRMWDNRRRKAGSLEARYERLMAGAYNKGKSPRESLKKAVAAQTRKGIVTTIRGRLRRSLAFIGYPGPLGSGSFVECRGCRKPLYRPGSRFKNWQTHWHQDCWRESLRANPGGYRPPRKAGTSISDRVRLTLLHDGLGKTVGQLAMEVYEASDPAAADAIGERIRRGRRDLQGLTWGRLFPAWGLPSTHIHKVLRAFPVNEVLQMAAGVHPLSGFTDTTAIARIAPQGAQPLVGLIVGQSELSQLVAEHVNQRFQTIHEAAVSVGITQTTLRDVMTGRHQVFRNTTWAALSQLTGRSIDDLRPLNAGERSGMLQTHWRRRENYNRPTLAGTLAVPLSELSAEHPTWGATRLHRALDDEGWTCSKETVSTVLATIRDHCPVCEGRGDRHDFRQHRAPGQTPLSNTNDIWMVTAQNTARQLATGGKIVTIDDVVAVVGPPPRNASSVANIFLNSRFWRRTGSIKKTNGPGGRTRTLATWELAGDN